MGRRYDALEGPAIALARSLRAEGHADLAAGLAEVSPASESNTRDDLRPLLRRQLLRIAADETVATGLRDEARRLAAVAADPAAAIGRLGRVWLAWDDGAGDQRAGVAPVAGGYWGSWQPEDPDDHDLYEQGPRFASLDEALAWARARTDRVVVRPAWDEGTSYWAGPSPAPYGMPLLGDPPR